MREEKVSLNFTGKESCTLTKCFQDLEPTIYLKDPERFHSLEYQLSPPKPKEQQSATPQPEEPFGIAIQHAMGNLSIYFVIA